MDENIIALSNAYFDIFGMLNEPLDVFCRPDKDAPINACGGAH